MTDAQRFDITVYGATGFTGRLLAEYLCHQAPAELRLAIAGRNEAKLRRVLAGLPAARRDSIAIVVADSTDADSVDAMCAGTRVIATTAGPFAKYGDPVVEACVRHATDYVDITGETPWVRSLIDRFHEEAAEKGVRIVPFCGYDSVPADIGSLAIVEHFRREHGIGTRQVRAFYQGRGGLNGGTLASALNLLEEGATRELADPLLLNPPAHRDKELAQRQPDQHKPVYDEDLGAWTGPFFMAPVNTRVVRRSAALAEDLDDQPWGDPFLYHESMPMKSRVGATALAAGSAAFETLGRFKPVRRLLEKVGPDPGEGPSEKTLDEGWFRTRYVGVAEDGRKVEGHMRGQGDPGNRTTVCMLGESALCLAVDRERLPGGSERGGILTPATALGMVLAERLQDAGIELVIADKA